MPTSNTEPHNKAINVCSNHGPFSGTGNSCIDDGVTPESTDGLRDNTYYKVALGGISIPTLSSSGIIQVSQMNAVKQRLNDIIAYWGQGGTALPMSSVGDMSLTADYNELVSRVNQFTGTTGIASDSYSDGDATDPTLGKYYNFDLENISPAQITTASVGQMITRADWNALITRINTISNACVCNMDCACNWVCNNHQLCMCNQNYSYTETCSNGIVDPTPDDRLGGDVASAPYPP